MYAPWPRFRDESLILVDPTFAPDHGRHVVIRGVDSNEATFKQVIVDGERKFLKALNLNWSERIMLVENCAVVCGVGV